MIDYDMLIDLMTHEDITNHELGYQMFLNLGDDDLWTFFQDYASDIEGLMNHEWKVPKNFMQRGKNPEMETISHPVMWVRWSGAFKAPVYCFKVTRSKITFHFYSGHFSFNEIDDVRVITGRRFGRTALMFREPKWNPDRQLIVKKRDGFGSFKKLLKETLKLLDYDY